MRSGAFAVTVRRAHLMATIRKSSKAHFSLSPSDEACLSPAASSRIALKLLLVELFDVDDDSLQLSAWPAPSHCDSLARPLPGQRRLAADCR